ncbi:hypothetical protein ACFWM1_28775 [Nocardia sp. NPDC058379]|uniref:hypothetical protein n=1 Tax=unclassified Nocardia TaxID=2637762 RepID=UPI00365ABCA3
MWPTEWPTPARAIATAIEAALLAAQAADEPGFGAATGDLAELPADQVSAVLAAVVRELLEIAHPDGLTGDDVRAVLEAVVRRSVVWLPRLDPAAVVGALTGALGIDEGEDRPPTDPRPAAILLIDHLATTARVPARESVLRAITEIARAEIVEMP